MNVENCGKNLIIFRRRWTKGDDNVTLFDRETMFDKRLKQWTENSLNGSRASRWINPFSSLSDAILTLVFHDERTQLPEKKLSTIRNIGETSSSPTILRYSFFSLCRFLARESYFQSKIWENSSPWFLSNHEIHELFLSRNNYHLIETWLMQSNKF